MKTALGKEEIIRRLRNSSLGVWQGEKKFYHWDTI